MCNGRREELITRRKQSIKTQHAVAAEIGISQAGYSLIENGYRNPNKEDAEKLIEMFGLPEGYFGDLSEEEAQ